MVTTPKFLVCVPLKFSVHNNRNCMPIISPPLQVPVQYLAHCSHLLGIGWMQLTSFLIERYLNIKSTTHWDRKTEINFHIWHIFRWILYTFENNFDYLWKIPINCFLGKLKFKISKTVVWLCETISSMLKGFVALCLFFWFVSNHVFWSMPSTSKKQPSFIIMKILSFS